MYVSVQTRWYQKLWLLNTWISISFVSLQISYACTRRHIIFQFWISFWQLFKYIPISKEKLLSFRLAWNLACNPFWNFKNNNMPKSWWVTFFVKTIRSFDVVAYGMRSCCQIFEMILKLKFKGRSILKLNGMKRWKIRNASKCKQNKSYIFRPVGCRKGSHTSRLSVHTWSR